MRRERGFTLVEVLVAFTMLAMVITAVLQIFSQGSRVTALAGDYHRALRLAEGHLAEVASTSALVAGRASGEFAEGIRWQRTISERNIASWDPQVALPLEVSLEVSWQTQGQAKSLQLQTLVLAE